mmetsp:Transcript_36644/g.113393  ORF Transcript_36644/g.113393 Transcript_36644/m.113393 type:complete len:197 (+) Transcript_36644:214-804(+)
MSCQCCNGHAPVFEVQVRSERFKFNAAHFVAFKGFRERLHGHNYTVGVRVFGPLSEGDGYVLDFGDVKKATRSVCEKLNERFLCPCASDVLTVTRNGPNVEISCEDGSKFSIPEADCAMLPIVHSTAEELAALLWRRTIEVLGVDVLRARGVTALEVAVAEAPTQEARYRRNLAAFESAAEKSVAVPTRGCAAFAA